MTLMWQLFKVFRRNLWLYLGVEVVIVFLIALNDIRSQNPESALDSLGVSAFLALLLSLCLRMPSRLIRMPFPSSVTQRAMLPVLAFVILWACGIGAIFAAALFFGFSPAQWCIIVGLMIQRLPFYMLGFLMVYRLFQLTPHWVGCVFVVMFVPKILNDTEAAFWDSWYFVALPAALALIAFYLAEIPRTLAGQDRLLLAQGQNQPVSWMRDSNIDSRQTLITWVGRVIDAVLFFGAVLCIGLSFGEDFTRVQTYMARPWLSWIPLSVLFLFITLFREGYSRAAASGFGPYASVWTSLLRITIILNPLAEALGVKKGVVAQCDQCHTAKFIWAQHCPHCGFPGPGTILNKQMARLARGDALRITMRQRIGVRLMIPLQLLLMFGVFGRAGSRPFEAHTVLLKFQDAQVAAQAVSPIQAWIDAHADVSTKLEFTGGDGQIPQKYRLQVVYYQGNEYMTLEAYGLRWDPATQLPAIVADHLGKSLPEAGTFTVSPMKQRLAFSPFMQTRTYLDNKLHWVQRESPTPRRVNSQKNNKNVSAPRPKAVK
ncbi:MAG: hypothetical protein K9N55_08435 [Phycisphaerae bacterium]|nr:hypothetical protein [Phycisphaerae bacterium]